ncbi:unnamed protein product, partial [Symbiodinium microadriaticum]
LIEKDVRAVMVVVERAVHLAYGRCLGAGHDIESLRNTILDTPRLFFVSVRLAQIYNHIMESAIISAYHSYFPPGRMTRAWKYEDTCPFHLRSAMPRSGLHNCSVVMAFLWFLQLVGTLQCSVQRVIMHLFHAMALGLMALLLEQIVHNIFFLLLLVGIIAYEIAHFLWRKRWYSVRPSASDDQESESSLHRIPPRGETPAGYTTDQHSHIAQAAWTSEDDDVDNGADFNLTPPHCFWDEDEVGDAICGDRSRNGYDGKESEIGYGLDTFMLALPASIVEPTAKVDMLRQSPHGKSLLTVTPAVGKLNEIRPQRIDISRQSLFDSDSTSSESPQKAAHRTSWDNDDMPVQRNSCDEPLFLGDGKPVVTPSRAIFDEKTVEDTLPKAEYKFTRSASSSRDAVPSVNSVPAEDLVEMMALEEDEFGPPDEPAHEGYWDSDDDDNTLWG